MNNDKNGELLDEEEQSALEKLRASAPKPAEFKPQASTRPQIEAPTPTAPTKLKAPKSVAPARTVSLEGTSVPGFLGPITLQDKDSSPTPDDDDRPSRKWWWIGGAVAAVVLLLAGAVIFALSQGGSPPRKTAGQSSSNTGTTGPHAYFYYAAQTGGTAGVRDSYTYDVTTVDPVKQASSQTTLRTAWPLTSENSDPLQFSANGGHFAYAVNDFGDHGHTVVPNSYQLVFGEWQGTTSAIIENRAPGSITDWRLTADGQEIIYIEKIDTGDKLASFTLYSYSARNGQTTKVGAINRPVDRESTRLFEVETDKTVRYYTSLDDGIYETKYDRASAKLSYKRVAAKKYEWGSMGSLSPDGTKLVYYGTSSSLQGVIVYIINTISGNTSTLIKNGDPKLGYNTFPSWSPESKLLLLGTTPYGAAAQEMENFPNQLFTIDSSSGERQTVASNSSPGSYVSNLLSQYDTSSWSPDGKYAAYTQDNRLYIYDFQTRKVVTSVSKEIARNRDTLTGYHFGWIQK